MQSLHENKQLHNFYSPLLLYLVESCRPSSNSSNSVSNTNIKITVILLMQQQSDIRSRDSYDNDVY